MQHSSFISGFIAPCLPSPAGRPPTGPGWVRNGHDWSGRFPLIAEAAGALKVRSFLIDGEAVACDSDGMPNFDRLRYRRADASVFLYAFDLLELNGKDLRRGSFEVRKATLASVLAKATAGLRLNEHMEHHDGEVVFRHACKMGLEGIVSKRRDSRYRSGPPQRLSGNASGRCIGRSSGGSYLPPHRLPYPGVPLA